ncbi:MAG: TetR/AcrR family transcriptional regulator [Actinomycetota bacterium]|nr:TetR/AcrR family transcriptional regulator [Actinomycetota bacterium]
MAPRRGRPRSEAARLAILATTTELLLEHGLAGVSMDAVAAGAGVSKATIYRWWPTKEILALEALHHSWGDIEPQPPGTDSLRGDLLALLLPWARRLRARPYGRVIAAFVTEAQSDPAFAEHYQGRFVEPRREQGRAALARAVARGELPSDTDVGLALDLLYGPIYHRLLHQHAPLTDRFVADVVDAVLRSLKVGQDQRSGP